MNDFIEDMPDGTKKVKFDDKPVMVAGTEVKSIVMREPTVDDQMAVDHVPSPAKKEIAILANLCEMSPEDIGTMKMVQYGRLQFAYQAFMG